MWCENEIEYILEHLQDPEKLMDSEFVRMAGGKRTFGPFRENPGINGKLFLRLQQEGKYRYKC